ncbi:hypothetical protein, partial [Zemynaea arenosa]|uniref:hypothetical protein n=1 Tax=Zemynaea arenosa TaxID=2561931 RepID=UPI001C704A4A
EASTRGPPGAAGAGAEAGGVAPPAGTRRRDDPVNSRCSHWYMGTLSVLSLVFVCVSCVDVLDVIDVLDVPTDSRIIVSTSSPLATRKKVDCSQRTTAPLP